MWLKISPTAYSLIWTMVSTSLTYLFLGISEMTITCFCTGIILAAINLIEDERKYYAENNKS